MEKQKLNSYAAYLVKVFSQNSFAQREQGISVNPIVSELASWYERLRNAMDYKDDEVVLRSAIERILKRRLMLGGNGESVASPLVRELIWARYFPDGTVPEGIIQDVEEVVDNYLLLKQKLQQEKKLKDKDINTWIFHLMSSHIERVVNPHAEKETLTNFVFHVLQDNVRIQDDSEDTRNAQVFIAVRRAYAKDDLAFLRFYLFQQYFGAIRRETIPTIADKFTDAYKEIEKQLHYPLTHRIFNYIKRRTPPFLILETILRKNKTDIENILTNEELLRAEVFQTCQTEYATISSKVRRAIIRSVIFLFISKAFFALAVEGTYERLLFGQVLWEVMALNIIIPPFLMVIAGLFIRTPNEQNTIKIFEHIKRLLYEKRPQLDYPITLELKQDSSRPYLTTVFTILWFGTFLLSFGLIMYVLRLLHFNLISQGVFLFFLTIISFLTLRINKVAHMYTLETKPSVTSTVVDFFYLPIAQVGRYLTEGIAQINILLFVLDFIIETPFKGLFMFFEQWFLFLHSKREYMD